MNDDEKFMKRTISLANSADPSPNPKVGAVIVKDGKIIAEGFHKRAGMAHAEIEALSRLGKGRAKGCTLYVTLEPCSHYGRTPPCTKRIIGQGIAKVIYSVPDPTRKVRGKEELKKAGIEVKEGVLRSVAEKLNPAFLKIARTGMPFVTLKAAMSLDGKISYGDGKGKKISGKEAHEYSHKLRAKNDAILVGIGTVLKDNPKLTARLVTGGNPIRIVLDSKLRIPIGAKVIGKDGKLIVAACTGCNVEKKRELEGLGVKVLEFGGKEVPVREMLKRLGTMGVTSLLVEGGANVNWSFVKEKLVDKFCFFICRITIGKGKDVFGGQKLGFGLEFERVERIGKDILAVAVPKKG